MKIHLKCSDTPLTFAFRMIAANCGEPLFPVSLAYMWDEQVMGAQPDYSTVNVCKKCLSAIVEGRYVYAIYQSKEGAA